jgi:hypothetical protein
MNARVPEAAPTAPVAPARAPAPNARAAASAVVIGTAAISPIEPQASRRLLGHDLEVRGVRRANVGGAKEQEDRQGGADVREHERVDGGAHVVAADVQRASEELADGTAG